MCPPPPRERVISIVKKTIIERDTCDGLKLMTIVIGYLVKLSEDVSNESTVAIIWMGADDLGATDFERDAFVGPDLGDEDTGGDDLVCFGVFCYEDIS